MTVQADKNSLSITAMVADVEAMLYQNRKKFVAKALPHSDETIGAQLAELYKQYVPLTATIFIRDDEVEDGELRFLTMNVSDPTLFVKKLQYVPVGFLVPDIHVADMTSGLNKDRHINPDDTLRVDTLQLLRGIIEASSVFHVETIGVAIAKMALDYSSNLSLVSDPSVKLLNNGLINLNLLIKATPDQLDALVTALNEHPERNPAVTFGVTTLNKHDYEYTNRTIN